MDIQLLLLQAAQTSVERSIFIDILKAVLPGIVVAVIGLLIPQIRNAIFYKRTEYDFEYFKDSDSKPSVWDIH